MLLCDTVILTVNSSSVCAGGQCETPAGSPVFKLPSVVHFDVQHESKQPWRVCMPWCLVHRCISMLADLYNAPCPPEDAVGAACIGSSEAIMLAGEPSARRIQPWGWDASKPSNERRPCCQLLSCGGDRHKMCKLCRLLVLMHTPCVAASVVSTHSHNCP